MTLLPADFMKILYIANERRAAGLAAHALHGIAPNVTLTWAQTLGSALQWLRDNGDTTAVVVENEVNGQGCASFVEQVRGLDRALPVVVVAPAHLGPPSPALEAGADDYVVDDPSLQADLPRVVTSVLQRRRRTREAEQRWASKLAAAAARLADGEAQHKASLARESRICTELQVRLIELEAAVRSAEDRRASDAAAAADQLATRHAEFTASLAQAGQWRHELAQKLAAAMAALDEAREARASETVAAAEHLARREAELGAALAEAVAARTALEHSLARAENVHHRAQQRAAADLAAAAERQAALEDRLAREADRCATAERKHADSEAARRHVDARHTSEMAAAAKRLSDLQSQYDAAVTAHTAASAAFEQRLARAAAALEEGRRERAAETAAAAERLAARESELGAALGVMQAAKAAVELTLAETEAAHRDAHQRAAADLDAASERHASLERLLSTETAARATVERDLASSRTDTVRTRGRLLHVVSEHRRRAREQQAQLEARLSNHRDDAERTIAAKNEAIRQIELTRDSLQQSLGKTEAQLQHLHATLDDERLAHDRTRQTGEAELQRLSARYDELRQSRDQLQTAFQRLERVAGEHAAERGRLERVVADRDAQLSTQAERHLAAEQAAQHALTQVQDRLRVALETSSSEVARLQREIDALRHELAATRTHAEAMRIGAEQVPVLQAQLDESQREKRRQFERAPYGLCVCTPEGVIAHANHSLVRLLAYRRADDLRRIDFAATVFDDAGELRWLIERSASTGRSESIETTWKTRDRRRLVVRLQALATTNGSVEIVVEDITHLRALEQRLHQAHRMEAVGRLASEVAVTCDRLLRDAARAAEQSFAGFGTDTALRHQGEMLLSDVTRAASLLRQLAVYGNQQASALEPVNVHRVLRALEPVLKRVAGEDIELVLPRASSPADVDVDTERIERILINVASYARGRMPYGGQVRVDVASTVVGRTFITRYPNVRPGPHVVVTVTEVRRTVQPEGQADGREDSAAEATGRSGSTRPGVDLGVLLELVGTCGGHLWMEAEPAGNMTLKIHLPKRPAEDLADSAVAVGRGERSRQLSRWFRSNTPAPAGP